MAKTVQQYIKDVTRALKSSGRYSKELDAQIIALGGMMRTLCMANDEIDRLETTTIAVITRYGNESLAPHPVFKIQKDAQDAVTRQMKALSLTAEELAADTDNDPLVELTRKIVNVDRTRSGREDDDR